MADGSDDQFSWMIFCREVGKIQKRNLSQKCFSFLFNHEDRPYKHRSRGCFLLLMNAAVKHILTVAFIFRTRRRSANKRDFPATCGQIRTHDLSIMNVHTNH